MVTAVILGCLLLPFLLVGGTLALFWRRRRRSILRWSLISYLVLVFLVIFVIGPPLLAWSLIHAGTRPPDRQLRDSPADYQVQFEDVVFDAQDNVRLSGWFIPPTGKSAVIICAHGLFRNRIEVLPRIMALAKAGYGALLYDSRSHGTSDKAMVSLGYYEKNDILGAMQYIERRYEDAAEQPKIVLMGVSMGAVAVLEAAAETRGYAALILDSPFSSLRDTVIDHSWLFLKMPRYLFPPIFLFWFQHFAKFDPSRVDSHKALQRIQPVPILFIASKGDFRIRPGVAQSLYAEAQAPVKKLEVFGPEVTHGAAARLHPRAYSSLILGFLEKALAGGESGAPDAVKSTSAAGGYPR
ncbi:MAG TPA: alpha/beta fold hydrolase [Acidobacteriota bacterium]|nr:alpha/beta fold hydrolase [Acidobacteriota bacterium]